MPGTILGTEDTAVSEADKTPAILDKINNMVDAYCHGGKKLSREGIGDVEEIMVAILKCSRRGSLMK